MSDWIWSGQLNPVAFPNNLARYFLQIPAIFEQQLAFSTTLIFDEPSFRNGIQVSGFIDRPIRELVISLIGQKRRSWYTMTHHALLSTFTARKHGIADRDHCRKLVVLTEHVRYPDVFGDLEQQVLRFVDMFATDPKGWGDEDCIGLKRALFEDNRSKYAEKARWMDELNAARSMCRAARATGKELPADKSIQEALADADFKLPDDANERMVSSQLVELAFLCMQFVALTDVFTGLNIPDEGFLPDVMTSVLSPEVINRLNELNLLGGDGLENIVPPSVDIPIDDIVAGRILVEPAPKRGSRVPLVSYEIDTSQATRDKGLAVGGVQVGVWGWSFGTYFPGGLVYLLMHHPELARFEAPYSLPLLFNEDEWRNGTQTGGFVTRKLKEIVYLKIYTTTRSRYGLEHHTMFLFNLYLDEYGVGRPPNPPLSETERASARDLALKHAENVVIYAQNTSAAPRGTYTDLELATMEWVGRMITHPHSAYQLEPRLRQELSAENRREVGNLTRKLDASPGLGDEAAHKRLVDHQIAELAMLTGHMDGLGRAMTILRLESEDPTKVSDRFLTDRPSLFQAYDYVGVTKKAQTANELRLNPRLLKGWKEGKQKSPVSAPIAAETGEF